MTQQQLADAVGVKRSYIARVDANCHGVGYTVGARSALEIV